MDISGSTHIPSESNRFPKIMLLNLNLVMLLPQNGLSFILLTAGKKRPLNVQLSRMMLNTLSKLMLITLSQLILELILHQNTWEKQPTKHYVFPVQEMNAIPMILHA